MSTAPNTVTGLYTDDLLAIANNITDVGEPGMTSEAITQMIACVLGDDLLYQRSIEQIRDLHFRADEPDLAVVRQALVNVHARSDVRPSLADLQAVIADRIQEEQRQSSGVVPPGLNEAIGT